MSLKFDNASYLGTMLACSLLVHLALIASIKFRAPDLNTFKEKIPQLEVVLVNAKTETAPKKASLLAQANLDHGGNSSKKQRAKTPLTAMPAPPKQNAVGTASATEIAQPSNQTESKPQDSVHLKQEKVRELEQKVKQVMEQANAAATVEKAPSQPSEKAASNPSNPSKPDIKAIVANSLSEAARYEAELSKEHKAYQERPRREFIGSRAREDRFAFYVEAWRQKVERIGNLNYPQEAKTQKLYGTLIMTVSIKADGSIESIEVDKKSNFKVLDDAARRIVELGSPYAPFPDNIRKDTDIIVITRTWSFTREDTWFSQ